MKGYFIITDNAPVHVPEMIDPIIMKQGYTPVYIPPYSPKLNPIKQVWAIIKAKVKRGKLSDVKTLTIGLIEAGEEVPMVHLQNIIQYSVNQFGKCRN
ncbi:hypothetical protein G6F43_013662 [Rhizopus delemar]|nr:hypothetical protein G6F43_013662 [Rhizopus delemar]